MLAREKPASDYFLNVSLADFAKQSNSIVSSQRIPFKPKPALLDMPSMSTVFSSDQGLNTAGPSDSVSE